MIVIILVSLLLICVISIIISYIKKAIRHGIREAIDEIKKAEEEIKKAEESITKARLHSRNSYIQMKALSEALNEAKIFDGNFLNRVNFFEKQIEKKLNENKSDQINY